MFTKEDYIDYFKTIQELERHMISNIKIIMPEIEDPNVLNILEDMLEDEFKHLKMDKILLKIANESL